MKILLQLCFFMQLCSNKINGYKFQVSALEWDLEGKQLLVATTVGDVSVYGQKDFLLNDWTCLYSANFPGKTQN